MAKVRKHIKMAYKRFCGIKTGPTKFLKFTYVSPLFFLSWKTIFNWYLTWPFFSFCKVCFPTPLNCSKNRLIYFFVRCVLCSRAKITRQMQSFASMGKAYFFSNAFPRAIVYSIYFWKAKFWVLPRNQIWEANACAWEHFTKG